jgi:hypothetical protein
MGLDPEPVAPRRHPRPPVYYVTPSGWRARCSASGCGWEEGHLEDQSAAIGAFLAHAENEHGIVLPEDDE